MPAGDERQGQREVPATHEDVHEPHSRERNVDGDFVRAGLGNLRIVS